MERELDAHIYERQNTAEHGLFPKDSKIMQQPGVGHAIGSCCLTNQK